MLQKRLGREAMTAFSGLEISSRCHVPTSDKALMAGCMWVGERLAQSRLELQVVARPGAMTSSWRSPPVQAFGKDCAIRHLRRQVPPLAGIEQAG
mmetsp:Transcript_101847/g.195492  ORF Transcript_101847/g.195492 Transcript_101847/m.195492 type:complete len:95 (+) Transcript_101847:42-326(+)